MALGGDLVLPVRRRLPRRQQHRQPVPHRQQAVRALRRRDRALRRRPADGQRQPVRARRRRHRADGYDERRHRVDQAHERHRLDRAQHGSAVGDHVRRALERDRLHGRVRVAARRGRRLRRARPTVTPTNANGGALDWSAARSTRTCGSRAGRTCGASRRDQLRRLGTITFRSMPSDATLVIAVTGLDDGHLEGAELLRHRHHAGQADPDRPPERDGADAAARAARPSRARSWPRARPCRC